MNFLDQLNQAEVVKASLKQIDLNSADIVSTEQQILQAIIKSQNPTYWNYTPIAPLAQPANLQDLIGDLFQDSLSELGRQAKRLDIIYSALSDTNNFLQTELQATQNIITKATDSFTITNGVDGVSPSNYYWVGTNLNSTTFIDKNNTTALVNTDGGYASLLPSSLQNITNFTPSINHDETVGIPGCNTLIINQGIAGNQSQLPQPQLESANSSQFSNMFNSDGSSWFELENVFLPPTQPIQIWGGLPEKAGAYVYSPGGTMQDIKGITNDLDWEVEVQWFDLPNTIPCDLVQFKSINSNNTVSSLKTITNEDGYAILVFSLKLQTPQPLSMINIVPYIRDNASAIYIESITVYDNGFPIIIAEKQQLGTSTNSQLETTILNSVNIQTQGSTFMVPTDRKIDTIEFRLYSPPAQQTQFAGRCFAHPYSAIELKERSVRNYVLWTSVDTWTVWQRQPVYQSPNTINSKFTPNITQGSVSPGQQIADSISQLTTQVSNIALLGQSTLEGLAAVLTKSGSTSAVPQTILSAINAGLQKIPIVGGVVDSLLQIGSYSHTNDQIGQQSGYDEFSGWRAAVAIKNITISQIQYQPSSTLQTIALKFPGPVKNIGLFVEEEIPSTWGSGSWIEYYISTDAKTWESLPKLKDVTINNSYAPSTPTDTFYFKAVFNGNPNDVFRSPIIYSLALEGLPND